MAANKPRQRSKVNKKKGTKRKRPRLSRFGRFLRDNDIAPLAVADAAGVSRQHLLRLRYGTMEPKRPLMIWITVAVRAVLGGRRRVRITELFDLGDGER